MSKRLKLNRLLALTLVLLLLLSKPVFALAEETTEDPPTAEEISEEVIVEMDEPAPEIVSTPVDPPVEEAEEILLVDPSEEAFVADESWEGTSVAEDTPVEAETDMGETIPEVTIDPAEQSEEDEETPVDGSDTEESDEEAVELPPTDLEEAVEDFPEEPIESSEEPGNDETDTDTETESFIVRFDLCGHGEAVEAICVTSGDTLEKPDNPRAEGFTFIGWYREASCEWKWDFDTDTVTEDMTLYAGWEEIVQEESTEQEQADEETIEMPDVEEEPAWTLSLPGSQAIAYKAERTKIGTIAVTDASHFADGQAVSVTLDYSSFSSDDYSIPIVITVIQNGTEYVWNDGTSCSLNPDGSDPITVYVNISAEAWDAAPHGSYAMSIQFRSALLGR